MAASFSLILFVPTLILSLCAMLLRYMDRKHNTAIVVISSISCAIGVLCCIIFNIILIIPVAILAVFLILSIIRRDKGSMLLTGGLIVAVVIFMLIQSIFGITIGGEVNHDFPVPDEQYDWEVGIPVEPVPEYPETDPLETYPLYLEFDYGYNFYTVTGCDGSVTDVYIPDSYNGYPIGGIAGEAFRNSDIVSITLPSSIEVIGRAAFYNCTSLESIVIPENVTRIEYEAFAECYNLNDIYVYGCPTYVGGWAFDRTGYYNDPMNWDNGVLYIGSILASAELREYGTDLYIREGTTVIADYSVSGEINYLYIPASLENINDGLYSCESFNQLYVDPSNNVYCNIENCLVDYANERLIKGNREGVIPTDYRVREIGPKAFVGCSGVERIDVPSNIRHINGLAFSECESLRHVVLHEGVEVIGSQAFFSCPLLETVDIPASVCEIYSDIFSYSTNLKRINISPSNQVYTGNGTYVAERETQTLVVGIGTTVIPDDGSVRHIAGWAFDQCYSLTSIYIPDSVISIGECAFQGCYNLETAYISDSVQTVGNFAFSGCENIIIYCEAYSESEGWDQNWNWNFPVVWGSSMPS